VGGGGAGKEEVSLFAYLRIYSTIFMQISLFQPKP